MQTELNTANTDLFRAAVDALRNLDSCSWLDASTGDSDELAIAKKDARPALIAASATKA